MIPPTRKQGHCGLKRPRSGSSSLNALLPLLLLLTRNVVVMRTQSNRCDLMVVVPLRLGGLATDEAFDLNGNRFVTKGLVKNVAGSAVLHKSGSFHGEEGGGIGTSNEVLGRSSNGVAPRKSANRGGGRSSVGSPPCLKPVLLMGGNGPGPSTSRWPNNNNPRSDDTPHANPMYGGGEQLGSFHAAAPLPLNVTKIAAGRVGLPTDNIGAGATSPLFTPQAKS